MGIVSAHADNIRRSQRIARLERRVKGLQDFVDDFADFVAEHTGADEKAFAEFVRNRKAERAGR